MRVIIALLGFLTLGTVGFVTWQLAVQLVIDLPAELGEVEQQRLRIATWLSATSFASMVLSAVCTAGYLWLVWRKAPKPFGPSIAS